MKTPPTSKPTAEELEQVLKDQINVTALMNQNIALTDQVMRLLLFMEAMNKYGSKIREEQWSNHSDQKKAEAMLYDALRSVLIPKGLPSSFLK